jgi:hypothetical protein
MTTPRVSHGAALLPDGRVLVMGGQAYSHSDERLSSAELYDPATGTFSIAPSMGAIRVSPVPVRLQDGTVLVSGGESDVVLSSAEIWMSVPGP